MKYDTDKINSIDILDVARKLNIDVRKRGTKYWTQCLWHADTNPSMVMGGKGHESSCHCFSCNRTFGVVDLVKEKLGVDFLGACEWLESNSFDVIGKDPGGSRQVSVRKLEALQAHSRVGCCDSVEHHTTVFIKEFLVGKMTLENSFVRCMVRVFGVDRTVEVMRKYWLCSYPARFGYPDVMFPLIDTRGFVRDIKVQGYECDERSERFFHGNGTCYWLGPVMKKDGVFNRECLFGEHLLPLYPDMDIALVESPKNACVGAAQFPDLLWVATGNKNMLKRDILRVLRGRRVAVFPDNDAFGEWSDKLRGMQDIATFACIRPKGLKDKEDIADRILEVKRLKN